MKWEQGVSIWQIFLIYILNVSDVMELFLPSSTLVYFTYSKPIIRRRQWHPTPVLLPGKSHGQRSLVGCSPWGCEESDTTEWLHFHFSLSCIGEGYGNPLQCSWLENPRAGGAWRAAVYGVAQSRTQLKQLSSSSMLSLYIYIYNNYMHLLVGSVYYYVIFLVSC